MYKHYDRINDSWLLTPESQIRVKSLEAKKIQYGHQAAILKVTSLKINRLFSIYTNNVLLKFGLDIESQTEVIFKDELKLESGSQKIQYGCQAAIL